MKTILHWLVLGGMISTMVAQEVSENRNALNDPKELTQLRNAWLLERQKAVASLDNGYLDSLETMRQRLEKNGNHKAVAAVDKEIQMRLAATAQNVGKLSNADHAKAGPPNKVRLSMKERQGLEGKLAGKIWRVDHEGEGLRWFFFQEDGKAARKSSLTNWQWSQLDGKWVMDEKGNVTVTCPGRTVQIFMSAHGTPQITLNRQGVLTVRPFFQTDLSYPGAGKE